MSKKKQLQRSSDKWIKFHEWLEEVRDAAPYFRGHVDRRHTPRMRPRVGRPEFVGEYSSKMEWELLREFRRHCWRYESGRDYKYWDWIVLAQHYGLPTRLLDWTTNPYIAAYYAVSGALLKAPARPGPTSIANKPPDDEPDDQDDAAEGDESDPKAAQQKKRKGRVAEVVAIDLARRADIQKWAPLEFDEEIEDKLPSDGRVLVLSKPPQKDAA